MTTTSARPTFHVTTTAAAPAWWFLGTRVTELSAADGPYVLEVLLPVGASPPRHVHHSLDDAFLVLAGELVVRCGEEQVAVGAGHYLRLPRGIPHTFRVVGSQPARLLLVHADRGFLDLVEDLGQPAQGPGVPPPGPVPAPERIEAAHRSHGVEILGPPLGEHEARAIRPDADRPTPASGVDVRDPDGIQVELITPVRPEDGPNR